MIKSVKLTDDLNTRQLVCKVYISEDLKLDSLVYILVKDNEVIASFKNSKRTEILEVYGNKACGICLNRDAWRIVIQAALMAAEILDSIFYRNVPCRAIGYAEQKESLS